MAASLDDKLVVAISSRALFNLEEENRIFESGDDAGYMQLQLERLDVPAQPGIAYSLVRKLLRFNDGGQQRVEVVILSRNDPVSGMRVFRSGAASTASRCSAACSRRAGRPSATCGRCAPTCSCRSTPRTCARRWCAGFPAARVLVESARASDAYPNEVRIAFDGDAVLFSDEAERVFQAEGLDAFQVHESSRPGCRCPKARSSRCWRRCTACSRPAAPRCASAPRWSRRAARRPTSARSAR